MISRLILIWKSKLFTTMRLTLFALLLTVFQGLALNTGAQSQNTRLTLKLDNTSMKNVLNSIEEQTDYFFLYNSTLIDVEQKISIDIRDQHIKNVLEQLFNGKGISYEILDRQILLSGVSRNTNQPRQLTVKGQVLDAQGVPLPGVSVVIKSTAQGTITDVNGNYSLPNVAGDATLVFSFVGMRAQEMPVGNRSLINLTLEEETLGLEEVVAIGYRTQKRESLTGSVSMLDMTKKENTPITNASQALHGMSGLWVNQAGGKPGQDVATIRIRGVGTLNNNNPLVLVDGIEYNMNEINPATIESITVLKDASAAIYGSRAANGVILVTTRKGKKGKTIIDYNFSHGVQAVTYLPDVVWDPIQYMQLRNQALLNEGKTQVTYSEAQLEEYRNGMKTDPYTYPNLNWFDLVTKNGYLQQHSLRISGGSDRSEYSLTLGYMDQDGILIENNHANRYSMDLNYTIDVSSRISVGATIKANYRKYDENAHGTSYFFNRFMRVLPIFTPYLEDGRYGNAVFATPGRNAVENLMMLVKEGKNEHVAQRLLAKVFADFKLPFDLTYSINLGVDKLDGYARQFIPFLTTYNPKTKVPYYYSSNPYAQNYDDNDMNVTFYHTLSWQHQFNSKHNLELMVGNSYMKFDDSQFTARNYGYFDNTLTDIDAGSRDPEVSGDVTEDALLSYFSRINYNFNEKYLLDATFRLDGSSRFGRGNRWGFFHGTSVGWRIDQENFFQSWNPDFVDLLKLRASYGQLGNQAVALYSYLNTVNLGHDYSFNNSISAGSAITDYSDPLVSWETTTSYNAGFDFSGWEGKMGLSFDIFKKRTTDILRAIAIPSQVGDLEGPKTNVGTVDNRGFEIEISHRNTIRDFRYGISAQMSYVKNEVIDLNGEEIISGRRITREGHPIDSYYLYETEGIYQSPEEITGSATVSSNVKPGYLRYRDQGEKDGKINGDDRIITGNSIPKYNYGFNVNLGYKGIQLDAFFQGVKDVDIYPTANLVYPINNGAGITKKWATGTWSENNKSAALPILTTPQGAPENYQNSTFWLQDASYLRLKNIQLSYDVPARWLSRLSMSKFTLFINGENLLTFSKFDEFDPEKDITNDNLYEYPSLKTYSFGFKATF